MNTQLEETVDDVNDNVHDDADVKYNVHAVSMMISMTMSMMISMTMSMQMPLWWRKTLGVKEQLMEEPLTMATGNLVHEEVSL
jgi:hypothetical protein